MFRKDIWETLIDLAKCLVSEARLPYDHRDLAPKIIEAPPGTFFIKLKATELQF